MSETVFLQKIGDSPQTRILDFLLTFRDFDYSPTDIAKEADVSFVTAKKVIENLNKQDVLKKTRKVGRATLYKLNEESEFVKSLKKLYDNLINETLELHKQKIVSIH